MGIKRVVPTRKAGEDMLPRYNQWQTSTHFLDKKPVNLDYILIRKPFPEDKHFLVDHFHLKKDISRWMLYERGVKIQDQRSQD